MSNATPVKLDLDRIFSKVSDEIRLPKSLVKASYAQSPLTVISIEAEKKKYAYRFIVENGGGTYLTEANNLDEVKTELLRRYKKILVLEKISK